MIFKLSADLSDFSGGVAYAFSIAEPHLDSSTFVNDVMQKIKDNPTIIQRFYKMLPTIASKNQITSVYCTLYDALNVDLIPTPFSTNNHFFIYASDECQNDVIYPYVSNPFLTPV